MQICGGPDLEDCTKCGGGPLCVGVVPGAQKASEMGEEIKKQLLELPSKLQQSKNKAGSHWKHRERFSNCTVLVLVLVHHWFFPLIGFHCPD